MKSFILTSAGLTLLFVLFWVGILALQPALALGWLCLSVPLAFVAGRTSVGALRGRRLAIVRDEPYRTGIRPIK